MAVVDASVLVPLFDAADAQHAKAQETLHGLNRVAVTGPSLLEFCTVLRRRGNLMGMDGADLARQALRGLRNLPTYRDTGDAVADAASRRYGKNRTLSLADAWAIEAALADGDDLLTFDLDQAAAWRHAKN